MATFRIHEDYEKENRLTVFPNQTGAAKGVKSVIEKRAFGAIVNAPLGTRDKNSLHPNVIRDTKTKAGSNKENEVKNVKAIEKGKSDGPIPLEQFKAFYVDENSVSCEIQAPEKAVAKISIVDKKTDVSTGAARKPLSEIKTPDFHETPMSISEGLSPMSVDKSMVEEVAEKIEVKNTSPTAERDRFFEIEEYQLDILNYLKEAETRNRPKPFYMRKQLDINHSMRTILVDWLVEVCEEYRLQSETLFLAMSYIDRFLSIMSVVRAKLQLVGTAAMFIAAKYEEIYSPDVAEFVYITDDTYTKKQVLRMEQLILKVLSFDLSVPTPLVFVSCYSIINDVPEKVKHLTTFFCELSLLEADPFLQYTPSKVAAAGLILARHTLQLPLWSEILEKTIGYKTEDLQTITLDLYKIFESVESRSQQAIQEKYRSNKFMQVSQISPRPISNADFDNFNMSIGLTSLPLAYN